MVRVLLVCTGNVCRSPMAEGVLRKLLREHDCHGEIVVESAGTFPSEGAPASSEAIDTAADDGIDLRGHAARPLHARLVGRADLILTMEPEHTRRLVAAFPEAEGKTFLLTVYGDPAGDPLGIPDPIGWGRDVYRTTYRRIEESLRAALPRILARVDRAADGGPGPGKRDAEEKEPRDRDP